MQAIHTEEIDPRQLDPLHAVEDTALYARLVASMWRNGWQGRPLLVAETAGELRGLTGSHRLAAAKCTGTPVPCYLVTMSAEQLDRATAEFQAGRFAVIRETGDAAAIALFACEMQEGR